MNSTKSAGSSKRTTRICSGSGEPALGTSKPLRLAGVDFKGDTLIARFANGTALAVGVRRYPRLLNATPGQRRKWRLIGEGLGAHWEEIDEDLSVENLLFASAKASVANSPAN